MKVSRLLCMSYLSFILVLWYIPMLLLGVQSFNANKYGLIWSGFTWQWYENLQHNNELISATLHSLSTALFAATISTALGLTSAWLVWRYRFRARYVLQGSWYIAMMTPDIVLAIALLCVMIALGCELGFGTLSFAHVMICTPFAAIMLSARLAEFDSRILYAALDLGAHRWQLWRTILLPLLWPAIMAAWLMTFTLSLDDVILSFFTTGPSFDVLPLRIYAMARLGIKPEMNAIATLLFSFSMILVVLAQGMLRRKP